MTDSMARPDLRELTEWLEEGRAAEVVAALTGPVAEEPGHVACIVVLARALEASSRPLEALARWRAAYALCPDSPVVRDELRRLAASVACQAAAGTRTSRALEAADESLRNDEPYHELDELIKELETARIIPDPKVEPVDSSRLAPDVEDVVSETLAKIYANQKYYEEAAKVYDKLAVQQKDRKEEFNQKASDIRQRAF
ncbi:MAG: tetratricopeptide (TPR) repeat protein [Rhodothermales bacterium]|jgi:tetratricopeptide (TPR) repeat protein